MDERDTAAALVAMQRQVATGDWALSRHARQELDAEVITPTEVREAIATGSILEHYPDAQRGPCCLLSGRTAAGRPLHIVCTTTATPLIIITVYVPQPPKWVTPTERRPR